MGCTSGSYCVSKQKDSTSITGMMIPAAAQPQSVSEVADLPSCLHVTIATWPIWREVNNNNNLAGSPNLSWGEKHHLTPSSLRLPVTCVLSQYASKSFVLQPPPVSSSHIPIHQPCQDPHVLHWPLHALTLSWDCGPAVTPDPWQQLLLLCSGDIESNPGPRSVKFPCTVCGKGVRWGQLALQCDGCDSWHHKSCLGMNTAVYNALEQDADGSWKCCSCGLPGFSSSLFSLDFSAVSSTSSVPSVSSPIAQSSPKTAKPTNTTNPKGCTQIRSIVVNGQGIKSKAVQIHNMIDSLSPHIIVMTETHLDNNVYSSELFPPHYNIYHKDRNTHGGGVLIAIDVTLDSYELQVAENNCELVWAMIHGKGRAPICVRAVYRPPRVGDDHIKNLHQVMKSIKQQHNPSAFVLGGDFNLPSISWQDGSIPPGARGRSSCESLLELACDMNIHQIVEENTRGNNILDLFFTTTPGLVDKVTVGPGIADHCTVIVDHKLRAHLNKPTTCSIYQYSKADWDEINNELDNFHEEYLNTDPDARAVSTNWTTIKCRLLGIMEKHIPQVSTGNRFHLPYITRDIKRDIRWKQRTYNRARCFNCPGDWVKFR